MSGLFRSMSMAYVAVTMADESSRATVTAIAAAGLLHLVDVSTGETRLSHSSAAVEGPQSASTANASQPLTLHCAKHYKRRAVQCASWLRKLEQIEALRDLCPSLPSLAPGAADPPFMARPLAVGDVLEAANEFWTPLEIELSLNVRLDEDMRRTLAALVERRVVVDACQLLDLNEEIAKLRQQQGRDSQLQQHAPAGDVASLPITSLHICDYVAGTVPSSEQERLRRLLFRMSRGNALIRFSDTPVQLIDPLTRTLASRVVFYIVFIGSHLRPRIQQMCDIVRAHLYRLPLLRELEVAAIEERQRSTRDNSRELSDLEEAKEFGGGEVKAVEQSPLLGQSAAEIYAHELAHLDREIEETRTVAKQTARALAARLHDAFVDPRSDKGDTQRSPLLDWRAAITREQVVCDAMQKARFHRGLVCMEGWVPASQLSVLGEAVAGAVKNTGWPAALVEVDPVHRLCEKASGSCVPPTAFPLTKFTSAFQTIVSTYGVPRYKEVNPCIFTIITFPFLFGVMYGDIGHGSLLALVAIALCVFERRLEARRTRGELGDMASMIFSGRYVLLFMALFSIYCGSVYNDVFSVSTNLFGSGFAAVPGLSQETLAVRPYPFGLEPDWQNRRNELLFYNSFKMKVSVLLGVAQMTLGVCLSLCNHLYFRDHLSAVAEFAPRLVLLLVLFGYMDFMILYKWCVDWSEPGAGTPPNLIQTMIQMFLSPGHVSTPLYSHQATVQVILLLLAFVSVPIMMCAKPCWRNRVHKRRLAARAAQLERLPRPDDVVLLPAPEALAGSLDDEQQRIVTHAGIAGNGDLTRSSDGEVKSQREADHVPLAARSPPPHAPHAPPQDDNPPVRTDSPPREDNRRLQLQEQRSSSRNITTSVGPGRCDRERKQQHETIELQSLPESKECAPEVAAAAAVGSSSADRAADQIPDAQVNDRADPSFKASTSNGADCDPPIPVFSFSEELVHSAIHTIEFVLGTVSNTASYLRLWALSLAHHQLALVFWSKMIMQYGLEKEGVYWSVIGFAVWAVATFAVLLCMDTLECFLHALRLHWVEFQNKFFAGDGIEFKPVAFEGMMINEPARN